MRKNPVGHGNLREYDNCVGMGLSIDWGFVVQKSVKDERIQKLIGVDGSQVYLFATDHDSDHLWGISAGSKSPTLTWINCLLTMILPNFQGNYVNIYLGRELGNNIEAQQIFMKMGIK